MLLSAVSDGPIVALQVEWRPAGAAIDVRLATAVSGRDETCTTRQQATPATAAALTLSLFRSLWRQTLDQARLLPQEVGGLALAAPLDWFVRWDETGTPLGEIDRQPPGPVSALVLDDEGRFGPSAPVATHWGTALGWLLAVLSRSEGVMEAASLSALGLYDAEWGGARPETASGLPSAFRPNLGLLLRTSRSVTDAAVPVVVAVGDVAALLAYGDEPLAADRLLLTMEDELQLSLLQADQASGPTPMAMKRSASWSVRLAWQEAQRRTWLLRSAPLPLAASDSWFLRVFLGEEDELQGRLRWEELARRAYATRCHASARPAPASTARGQSSTAPNRAPFLAGSAAPAPLLPTLRLDGDNWVLTGLSSRTSRADLALAWLDAPVQAVAAELATLATQPWTSAAALTPPQSGGDQGRRPLPLQVAGYNSVSDLRLQRLADLSGREVRRGSPGWPTLQGLLRLGRLALHGVDLPVSGYPVSRFLPHAGKQN